MSNNNNNNNNNSSSFSYENEIKELEGIPTTGASQYFAPAFPSNVFQSFGSILHFARDLNVQIPVPEFVFIGTQASGKSTLLESIVGYSMNHVSDNENSNNGNNSSNSINSQSSSNVTTKRAIHISLVNNRDVKEKPRVTLRRDLSQLEGLETPHLDSDWVADNEAELEEELSLRLSKFSPVPIFMQVEHESFMNITFIDTPGLTHPSSSLPSSPSSTASSPVGDEKVEKMEELVLSLVRPTHRHIVCVEPANEWAQLQMFNFVKRVDPSMTRTTLVYSKFHLLLKSSLSNTAKVNRFLASKPRDAQTFFVSAFGDRVRSNCKQENDDDQKSSTSVKLYRERVFQSYQRDRQLLDSLQFDKRFSESIGIHNLRRVIQQIAWKSYQNHIPQVLKRLRALKRDTGVKLEKLRHLLQSLDSGKLRTTATNYVVHFLQIIEKLIAGTSEGNPSVNGQTLLEEKNYGQGEWFDSNYQEIKVEAQTWKIPYFDSRLYGGQQFERLMAEFKSVVDHIVISEVTMDDIATAAGLNRLNNIPNFAYASCDIAQQKARDILGTLIDQLCKRAVYIMKRLSNVVGKIMETRRKNSAQQQVGSGIANLSTDLLEASDDDFERFPYFTFHVRDLYNEFVDQTAELVRDKCMDEFYCTAAIYWDLGEMQDLNKHLPNDLSDTKQIKECVVKLSSKIFDDLKSRISKNVMLKFYNFFLLPMQSSLWNTIQSTITCLSDSALAEIFEVNAVKEKLLEDEQVLKSVLEKCVEQEESFLKDSTIFSHPVQHKNSFSNDDEELSVTTNTTSFLSGRNIAAPPTLLGGF